MHVASDEHPVGGGVLEISDARHPEPMDAGAHRVRIGVGDEDHADLPLAGAVPEQGVIEGSHEVAFPAALRPDIAGAPMDFDMAQEDARRAGGSSTI